MYCSVNYYIAGPTLSEREKMASYTSVRWLPCLCLFSALLTLSLGAKPMLRAVNLGGWLVTEGWIKPSLFEGIPNKELLVILKSTPKTLSFHTLKAVGVLFFIY